MNAIFPFYSIGHFINEPGNPTEFDIRLFADMDEPDVDDIHKHTFYEIIWTEAGTSQQTIDYQTYIIEPGTLFFISPGQVHQFEEWQSITGGSIFFTESFFLLNQQNKDKLFELSFLDNFYSKPYLQPAPADFLEIVQTIGQLLRERNRTDYSVSIAQSLLHVLLGQIQRCVDAESTININKRNLVIYKALRELVEVYYASPLTASDYAEQLVITPHHLNAVVKQVTGKTTSALLRERVVLEAKRLLTFTDQSIGDIAAQLGFFDSSYFAKLFRAETGLSPGDFKASISEKYRTK